MIGLREFFELAHWWILVQEKPAFLYDFITGGESLDDGKSLFNQLFGKIFKQRSGTLKIKS